MIKIIFKMIKIVFKIILYGLILALGINCFVYFYGGRLLREPKEISRQSAECIMVLGASVYADGTPTPVLKDRLDQALNLYWSGAADKILLSGDNESIDYNEVLGMRNYCLMAGVPAKDIFLDHAGISTYDSVYRAKEIYQINSIIIVTQKYHEPRALYIADSLGMKAIGVAAEEKEYKDSGYHLVREILARDKDFIKCLLHSTSVYTGQKIEISGDGTQTW